MNYLEVDHPWVSHEYVPIYWMTFPAEATQEELQAFADARENWAKKARYPVAWVADLSNLAKASAVLVATFGLVAMALISSSLAELIARRHGIVDFFEPPVETVGHNTADLNTAWSASARSA